MPANGGLPLHVRERGLVSAHLCLHSTVVMKTVDVLQSESFPKRHYIGVTDDLPTRLADHNDGKSPHTAKFRPWLLRVAIAFADEAQAITFERYLKSGSGRAFAKKHF
jgi:predicted GIY-YIG superfamily endonuclease